MNFSLPLPQVVTFVWLLGIGQARLAAQSNPPASAPVPAATSAGATRPANYELSPGDSVSVTVFREPDLTTQQRLSRDGTINFPLLGVVRLGGKTTNDAAALIAGLLAKGYLIHPQVSVSIVDLAKIKFTILGQVTSPGAYDIPADQSIDILAAIARAGGFTRLADQSKVVIRRITNGQEETFKIDVKRLMNDKKSQRFPIQANDTISVGERWL